MNLKNYSLCMQYVKCNNFTKDITKQLHNNIGLYIITKININSCIIICKTIIIGPHEVYIMSVSCPNLVSPYFLYNIPIFLFKYNLIEYFIF